MLFELVLLIVGGPLLALATVCLYQIYRAQARWNEFRKRTNGLPLSDGRNIFCNHAIRWPLCRDTCNSIIKFNKSVGSPITLGWLLGTKFAACTRDLDLMKRIVLDDPNKNINRADLGVPLSEYMDDNIMLAEDDQWRRLRRAVAPALRANKFKSPNVLAEIETSIDKFMAAIESKFEAKRDVRGVEIEVDEMIHRYTLNLVFSCFYKQHELIDFKADECHWTRVVDEGLDAVIKSPMIKLGLMLPPIRFIIDWFIWNFHPQGEWRHKILHFIKLQLGQRIEAIKQLQELKSCGKQVNEDDFLLKDGTRFRRNMSDYIVDHLLAGKINESEFYNTSSFLMAAADKTAADSLVHTLYQLSINPEIQDKARKSIECEDYESEYLGWIMNESLRLMPPAPASCSRTISEDMQIAGGYTLPAGTLVVLPNYWVHRLPEYWGEDAEEFKPERWADTSHHHPLQYVPFGAGVRVCPGREFALFEMRKLLARLLLSYQFDGSPKADAFTFDSPFLVYLVANSPTYITLKRLKTNN